MAAARRVSAEAPSNKLNILADNSWISASKTYSKWQSMAERGFEWFLASHPSTLLRRLRRGTPQQYRWSLWKLVLRSNYAIAPVPKSDRNPNTERFPPTRLREPSITPDQEDIEYFPCLTNLTMREYLELANQTSSFSALIKIDVPRTFPGVSSFDSAAHEQLTRILNAFANYKPNVGYCQGLNFVAGFLLLVSDFRELETFGVLFSFMTTYKAEGLFRENFPLLRKYVQVFDDVMADLAPELQEHLHNEGVLPPVFLHQWLLTLFIRGLPLKTVVVVWDFIIAEGLPIDCSDAPLLRLLAPAPVLLSSRQVLQRFLLRLAFEEAIRFLKSLQHSGVCDECRIGRMLVKQAAALDIPEKYLQSLWKVDIDALLAEYSVAQASLSRDTCVVVALDNLADDMLTDSGADNPLHQYLEEAVEEDDEDLLVDLSQRSASQHALHKSHSKDNLKAEKHQEQRQNNHLNKDHLNLWPTARSSKDNMSNWRGFLSGNSLSSVLSGQALPEPSDSPGDSIAYENEMNTRHRNSGATLNSSTASPVSSMIIPRSSEVSGTDLSGSLKSATFGRISANRDQMNPDTTNQTYSDFYQRGMANNRFRNYPFHER